jgi:putative Mg2+ transporter-C (MgtC) family protein
MKSAQMPWQISARLISGYKRGGGRMTAYWVVQLSFLLRVAVAGVCGAVIGYERKNRLKEAGMRTHMLVSMGAALMMIVSKYGFGDVLGQTGVGLDPSRIAAQIVSGIGFLGAGMIFIKKQSVSGLTTAAGIWATAGIGMAIGARMFFLGGAATLLILFVQVVLHRNFRWLRIPVARQLILQADDSRDAICYIQEKLHEKGAEVLDLKAEKAENGLVEIEITVKVPPDFSPAQLLTLFSDNPHIKLVEY